MTAIPQHIGFIMDGNRRWAESKGFTSGKGHAAGMEALKETVIACADAGIERMTFYVMSKENFLQRAKQEIKHLLAMLMGWEEHADFLADYGLRLKILGNLGILPERVIQSVQRAMKKTEQGTRTVNLCLNYSGREEILKAVEDYYNVHKSLPKNEESIQAAFKDSFPDGVDLIVRTGGHQRLSNFLLWQSAYAELYFTDTLWPDFDKQSLKKALGWYEDQKRNFGV